MHRHLRVLLALVVAFAAVGPVTVTPAQAAIEGTCAAQAVVGPTPVDVGGVLDQVIELPKKADVGYRGAILVPPPTELVFSGNVKLVVGGLKLPIDDWSGASAKTETLGSRPYDLPNVPGGVVYRLEGAHKQAEQSCKGVLNVKLAGGKGRTGLAALAGTLAALLVLAACAVRRPPGYGGRPVIGAVIGYVLGIFVAGDLVMLGTVRLASPIIWVFPVVGVIAGVILGTKAPLGRDPSGRRQPKGPAPLPA